MSGAFLFSALQPQALVCYNLYQTKTMKKRSAFTVIELLIVLTIVSILISIVVVNFFRLQNDAKSAKVRGDLRILKVAVESYAIKRGDYPAALPDILLDGNIISVLPTDTFKPSDTFGYSVSPDKNVYAIWSAGENLATSGITAWVGKMPIPSEPDDIGVTNGTPPNENWH